MQIVHGLGGIKLRDAYSLIKNISKKKHDKIEKERPKFVEGSQKQGLTKQQAEELFELILKFAGYGFNKSHSTGYAIVAYQTAYLKTYFPAQYMAAFLTFESQANKVSDWIPYLEDCRRTRTVDPNSGKIVKANIEVRPPDVNLSDADFAVVFDPDEKPISDIKAHHGHVRFGLKAIKGVGDKAIEAIIRERHNGSETNGANVPLEERTPFTSLHDFCERVMAHGSGVLNKATVESLIKCGALDSLHGRANRAAMLATVEQAMGAAQKAAADKASGQGSLFGFGAPVAEVKSAEPAAGTLARVTPWPEGDSLAFEKEVLGFYVSSHPLERWKSWYQTFTNADTTTVKEMAQDARVVIAGLSQSIRTIVVKNGRSAGQKMAIVTFEDSGGAVEAVVFTDQYLKFGHMLEADRAVFLLGRIDRSRGDAQVIVERIVPIDGVPLLPGRLQLVLVDARLNGSGQRTMAEVAELIRPVAASGTAGFPLDLVVVTPNGSAQLQADPKLRIGLSPELVGALAERLGPGAIRVVGGVTAEVVNNNSRPWEKKRKPVGAED